ncbi:MAG: glycosyltransferase [Gemmatimonadaceae bacterium]
MPTSLTEARVSTNPGSNAHTGARLPHVLIVPSEEFVPKSSHLAGIFQYHQVSALHAAGFRTGALSISQALSIPMVVRAGAMRILGKPVRNALDSQPLRAIAGLGFDKLFRPGRFVTTDQVGGIPVVRIEGFYYAPPSPRTDHFGWIRAGLIAFDHYCRRFGRPDILHAHNANHAGLLAHRLSLQTGIPFVLTEHSSYFARGLIPRSRYPALREVVRAAAGVAFVSPSLREDFGRALDIDTSAMEWIPNMVDPSIAEAPLNAAAGNPASFTFLSIAEMIPIKNHSLLLRAFALAFGSRGDVRLRIGGSGDLLDSLKELARELKIVDQVDFIGRLSRSSVADAIDRCDAFVVSSLYETFGVVLIEAMARGKPVVSTDCGGPRCIITPGDGFLVASDDAPALAASMQQLVSERSRFHNNDLSERTMQRFGPQQIVHQLKDFYARALATHG